MTQTKTGRCPCCEKPVLVTYEVVGDQWQSTHPQYPVHLECENAFRQLKGIKSGAILGR